VSIQSDIGALRQRLLTMASHAAGSVRAAMKAYTERDDDQAARVEHGDNILDDLEKEIDELAMQLLVRAPLASDLRLIMVATKIGHDLERVGDEATAIARRALELNAEPPLRALPDLPRLAQVVLEMLVGAIDAFVTGNADRARAIIPRDRAVDVANRQFQRELTRCLADDPANITRCLNLMAISRRLERIGDHAKNIAEEVVYLSEARDIRHSQRPNPAAPEEEDRPSTRSGDPPFRDGQ
jgi:phosphate transport system protein